MIRESEGDAVSVAASNLKAATDKAFWALKLHQDGKDTDFVTTTEEVLRLTKLAVEKLEQALVKI
jgi:hypothetical protein